MARVAIIGAGFSGISAAAHLAAANHQVDVYEKNPSAGGRARQLITDCGFTFDMGPSWYWMPEVYEEFFNDFGFSVDEFYKLKLLDPSFEIVFGKNDFLSIPADYNKLKELFESVELGAGRQLDRFMAGAKAKYEAFINRLPFMPGLSLFELANAQLLKTAFKFSLFSSFRSHVGNYFSNDRLKALMEFPILFLGAMPQQTPSLYSMMNYAGLKLGTWYPEGGFGKVVESMILVAETNDASFHFNAPVQEILVEGSQAIGIRIQEEELFYDAVVSTADYEHTESMLIPEGLRNYTDEYWKSRVFAPSCLIFYIGLNMKLSGLEHHTLFFEENLEQHAREIYVEPQWPTQPLFYVCCPSRTDASVAPLDHENLFFLMPIAKGLEDGDAIRERYFNQMIERFEQKLGIKNLKSSIVFKRSYCVRDFMQDYNAFEGNAYGLANTLRQTAVFKPSIRNKKIKNLFYAGQLTVPGPGVPPSIISGKIVATQVKKYLKRLFDESIV